VETAISFLPVWIVMFPMFMTLVIYYVEQRSEKMRNALSVGTSVVTFLSVLMLYPYMMAGEIIEYSMFQLLPNLEISFRVDILAFLWPCCPLLSGCWYLSIPSTTCVMSTAATVITRS